MYLPEMKNLKAQSVITLQWQNYF